MFAKKSFLPYILLNILLRNIEKFNAAEYANAARTGGGALKNSKPHLCVHMNTQKKNTHELEHIFLSNYKPYNNSYFLSKVLFWF